MSILTVSCVPDQEGKVMEEINGHDIHTYEIDSCEYIGYISTSESRANYLTHKGNCKYCLNRK